MFPEQHKTNNQEHGFPEQKYKNWLGDGSGPLCLIWNVSGVCQHTAPPLKKRKKTWGDGLGLVLAFPTISCAIIVLWWGRGEISEVFGSCVGCENRLAFYSMCLDLCGTSVGIFLFEFAGFVRECLGLTWDTFLFWGQLGFHWHLFVCMCSRRIRLGRTTYSHI